MGKTVRTTISVPAELKARMEAAAEQVNWSAVACQAFEAKLAEIITRRGPRDMNDAITRLRESKRRADEAAESEGSEDGRRWAMEEAEAVELERLEALRASVR